MDFSQLHTNPYFEFLLYTVIGITAGTVNTLAGGGSLLTLPLLIFSGLDPATANGTNRIGVLSQSLFSSIGYKSKQVNTYPFELYLSIPAVIGSIIGSQIAIDISPQLFNRVLVLIMLFVVGTIILKSKKPSHTLTERIAGKYRIWAMLAFFFIGVYGGFIQAGVGYFVMFFLSTVNRMSLLRANAIKAFTVTIYIAVSLGVFYWNDKIFWKYGIYLALGGALGSWFASRWSVKKGDGVIKLFIVIAVMGMGIRLWFFN